MKGAILFLTSLAGCGAAPTGSTVESPAARAIAEPAPGEQGAEKALVPGLQRARAHCPSLRSPVPVPDLVGREFENAAVEMPGGMQMMMEAAVGDEYGLGSLSVLSALRGSSVTLLVARMTELDPPSYEIVEAIDLGVPCDHLVIETRTCDLDGKADPYVLALMDEQYACGGHGESSPALAWSVRGRRFESVDPLRVTCGSVSCEVDPPLRNPP